MPTEEWFKENPKVSAYISKELNERLLVWMKQRGIKKVSQALTAILQEHLEGSQINAGVQSSQAERVAALEGK
ncbi:MAG: hypothetical protein MUF49_26345 [Oculatellaceae cyanobacterium Prado106]|jgi:hypothetical protein|nr:hypothetical protein [Oculatellaceae cyanobacterium Prado106]